MNEEGTPEEVSEEPKIHIVEVVVPVYMRRKGHLVVVGQVVISTVDGETTFAGELNTDEGKEMAGFLTSGIATGMTLGAIVDPEMAKKIQSQLS